MSLMSRESRRLALVGLTAIAALGASATSAQANFQKTLTYNCTYPYVGAQPLKVAINADLPATTPAGALTPPIKVTAVATALGDTASALDIVGAKTIEGMADAKVTIAAPSQNVPLTLPITIPKQSAVGTVANGIVLNANGSAPAISLKNPGVATITVDALALNLIARKGTGEATVFKSNVIPADTDGNPETFDVPCALRPNQSTVIAKITVGDGGPAQQDTTPTATIPPHPAGDTSFIDYGYNAKGSATLKTLITGSLKLNGSINAKVGLPSGAFTADLNLPQTKGELKALGFLPVVATVKITATEKVTGTVKAGVLKANAKVRISLPSVTLFGIPLGGGGSCKAKNISSINLKSTQSVFYALEGGPIAGTFTISELVGCGFLTGIISPLTAGSGNAILLNLSPSA